MTAARTMPNRALWATEDAISLAMKIRGLAGQIIDTSDISNARRASSIKDAAYEIELKLNAVLPQKRTTDLGADRLSVDE